MHVVLMFSEIILLIRGKSIILTAVGNGNLLWLIITYAPAGYLFGDNFGLICHDQPPPVDVSLVVIVATPRGTKKITLTYFQLNQWLSTC